MASAKDRMIVEQKVPEPDAKMEAYRRTGLLVRHHPSSCESHGQLILATRYGTKVERAVDMKEEGESGECVRAL